MVGQIFHIEIFVHGIICAFLAIFILPDVQIVYFDRKGNVGVMARCTFSETSG